MAHKYYSGHKPHRSRLLSWLIILGLVILIIWLLSQWFHSLMHPYFPLNYHTKTKIAQVRVIQTHKPHYLDIELIILASDGHQLSDTHSLLAGDMWRLEGELITSPEALNFIGLYSGYKLTLFDGRYDPATSSNATFSVAIDNAGDDGFFKALYDHHTPVVQANKVYSNYLPADGKIYNVIVDQNGLSVEP
jgi:hypothetical protein